jgi:hypothetical protein
MEQFQSTAFVDKTAALQREKEKERQKERKKERKREISNCVALIHGRHLLSRFASPNNKQMTLVQLTADVCSQARENIVTVSRNSQTNEGLRAKECNSESRHSHFTRDLYGKNYIKKTVEKQNAHVLP